MTSVSSAIIRPRPPVATTFISGQAGFLFYGIDDIFGLTYLAIDKACLHTGDGFLGQDAFGLLNLHYREPGCIFPEGFGRNTDAGSRNARSKAAVCSDIVIGGCRSEVKNKDGAAVLFIGRHCVYNTVGADFLGAFGDDADTGLCACSHNEGRGSQVARNAAHQGNA